MSSEYAAAWTLHPDVTFLNHGSFGACPLPVLAEQQRLREEMELEPIEFHVRRREGLLDAARVSVGQFLNADPDDLALVPNATSGVNTVLRSLALEAGDELITTTHGYNAVRNALEFVSARAGARVVVAEVPFPIGSPDEVVDAVLAAVTPKTRLVVIDHVTSPTGLVFPVEKLVPALRERGVDTLVDGAHGPGMLPLDLTQLGASYYTGNFHKWVSAPKGAAFLHVSRDRQEGLRPLTISHGANSPRTDRSRFRLEFDWTGTHDPTAYLCVPTAIATLGGMLPGGWEALRARNHALVLEGRAALCDVLSVAPPAPDSMIGFLAALPLPGDAAALSPLGQDPLQTQLKEQFQIEVPVFPFGGRRLIRISAQLYNSGEEYVRLANALREVL